MELGRTEFHLRRVARARGREETPNWSPQNMWCFSVIFHVATCEFEIAKTGRRSISKDGIGRSHQDLAIRSLGSRVNPAFAPNTAVYAPVTKMPRTSLAHARARRDPGVGGCQNSAVHHLEVWFCKILARSNYMCCQRWGFLERIFISESRKLTAATG